jgi:hypothetical protein
MSLKELQEEIASDMRKWQRIENSAIASTGSIMEKAENPVIHLIMEIIQRDSQMHYFIEGWIADSLGSKAASLTYDELQAVWNLVEHHVEIEKRMVGIVEKTLDSLKGSRLVLQEYLLNYLLEDETKHTNLLKGLEGIKKGLLP